MQRAQQHSDKMTTASFPKCILTPWYPRRSAWAYPCPSVSINPLADLHWDGDEHEQQLYECCKNKGEGLEHFQARPSITRVNLYERGFLSSSSARIIWI